MKCPVIKFSSLAIALVLTFFASLSHGELLEAQFDFSVSKFVLHPSDPYLYASVPSHNSIAIINTKSLELEEMVFIGSSPRGLAISDDGSRLFVANCGSNFVGVLDTVTRETLPSLQVTGAPRDVEVGRDGILYVLADRLLQIDSESGASVGPAIISPYSGEIAISPSKDRLYYADYGLSPASLYQFDVTSSTAQLLWTSPHGGLSGSNGQDLGISHDGSFISYACGAGQGGYRIAKYRTSDMAILGSFATGAYPREITFSPDDQVAYTVHTRGKIDVWDTTTFLQIDSLGTSGEANELIVDRSGQYLFAAMSTSQLNVYSTGRSIAVPEPATLVLLLTLLLPFGVLKWHRGKKS